MKDAWESGDPYEYFMGRWSRLVAASFIDWLSASPGLRWIDVGCGTGALAEAILDKQAPAELVAVDQSEGFVDAAQRRLGRAASCRVGNAMKLPSADASVDIAVSGLVLNFIPQPENALAEMKRVTIPGGTVAVYVWDYAGTMEFLSHFWDAVIDMDPDAAHLREATRFADASADGLRRLFEDSGLEKISLQALQVETRFRNFADFWNPFLGGQGPAPTYVASLDESARNRLREKLQDRLPVESDGSIPMQARAWAARGQV